MSTFVPSHNVVPTAVYWLTTPPQELCLLYRASAKLPQIADMIRAHEGPHAALLAAKWVVGLGGGSRAGAVERGACSPA